ncbi:MAG: hypothetical protein HY823_10605 [Acidobacteria bacterium]|nr:hypothetical protein [Acidobacteriota bacterium]
MRLVSLLLTAAAVLAAQAPRRLPWEGLPPLPWQELSEELGVEAPPMARPLPRGPIRVSLRTEGSLRVLDRRGIVRLRTGLPGRPMRLWRDAGLPLPGPWKDLPFGEDPGGMWRSAGLVREGDPRDLLAGFLWILDDSGRFLSLVHPATAQVAFLPLPEAEEPTLVFRTAGLALQEPPGAEGSGGRGRRWLLPWMALLPAFMRLEAPAETPRPGTALQPYPREKGW